MRQFDKGGGGLAFQRVAKWRKPSAGTSPNLDKAKLAGGSFLVQNRAGYKPRSVVGKGRPSAPLHVAKNLGLALEVDSIGGSIHAPAFPLRFRVV